MQEKTFRVDEMSCNHCKAGVEKALSALDGIENAEVDLDKAQVTVKGEQLPADSDMAQAVEKAGYKPVL